MIQNNSYKPIYYALLNYPLISQIENSKSELEANPRFTLMRAHRAKEIMREEANKSSVKLEMKTREEKAVIRQAEENLRSAYDFFRDQYMSLGLDRGLLMDTVALIHGTDQIVPYRTAMAYSAGFAMIYPDNASEQTDELIRVNNQLYSGVEKAIHAHFHIARIHPFGDGNGRLARLVQNGILASENYPPIIIPFEERQKYLNTINDAAREYKMRDGEHGPKQSFFYQFLASRLDKSLNDYKDLLSKRN